MSAKRTHGECMGTAGGCRFDAGDLAWDHLPHCPSLYPLQPQPGDEPDALTRLKGLVRHMAEEQLQRRSDAMAEEALALISEAREEQMKKDAQIAALVDALYDLRELAGRAGIGGLHATILNAESALRLVGRLK